jgi:hypothetical protein
MSKVWYLGVMLAGALSACESGKTAVASGLSRPETVLTVPGAIAGAQRYQGMAVQVRGFDAGWQGECRSGPPVSRSDWHLQDGGQCLYVHGPRPAARQHAGKPVLVKVNGVLKTAPNGVLYLDAR